MKKIISTLVAAVMFTASIFAGSGEFTFTNELSSDIVYIKKGENTRFAGIEDRVATEFKTAEFDAGIDVSMFFDYDDGSDKYGYIDDYYFNDWYIEFRPFSFLTVAFHDVVETPGSYLPVADLNMPMGNIGSDVLLVWRPIGGLRIGTGFDLTAYFGSESSGKMPLINLGVDYAYGSLFTVGATFRGICEDKDDFGFGLYGSYTGIKGLSTTLGFGYNEEVPELYLRGNILSFGIAYKKDALSCAADLTTDFGKGSGASIYTGAKIAYDVIEPLNLSLKGQYTADFHGYYIATINPAMTYTYKRHAFSAGFATYLYKGESPIFAFPVSWKYSF